MSVDYDRTNTLRAEMHGRPPIVLCIEPRSPDGIPRIYDDEISPTLNTAQGGQRQPCVFVIHDESIQPD